MEGEEAQEGVEGAGGSERGRREEVGGEGGSAKCQLPCLGRARQEGRSGRVIREKERGRGGTGGRLPYKADQCVQQTFQQ